MAKTQLNSCLIFSFALAIPVLSLDPSQIQVFPKNRRISGVFEVTFAASPNQMSYAFNASQAREVCQGLNVTIASKAQVIQAQRNGFETCRYGWVDEQIAVIPRIKSSRACGQNQVGVIPWRTSVTRLFDVFCFNASDIEIQLDATTTHVPVTSKEVSGVSTSPSPHTVTLLLQSTRSTQSIPLSPTAAYPDLPQQPHPKISTESPFGALPIALLVTAATLILMAAFAALWLHRKNSVPFWKKKQQKEGVEAGVWKSSYQKELKEHQAERAEQSDRRNSEICLSVDPETKLSSS